MGEGLEIVVASISPNGWNGRGTPRETAIRSMVNSKENGKTAKNFLEKKLKIGPG